MLSIKIYHILFNNGNEKNEMMNEWNDLKSEFGPDMHLSWAFGVCGWEYKVKNWTKNRAKNGAEKNG